MWRLLKKGVNVKLKNIILCFFIILVGFFGSSFGKYQNVKSERNFLRTVRNPKFNLSIALFYNAVRERTKDPVQREAMEMRVKRNRSTKDMFKEASKIFRYDDADLMFSAINVGKRRTKDMARHYEVSTIPTFMLFQDGLPYKDSAGNVVKISGFLERPQLEQFINDYFNKLIEKNRKRNQEIRKIRIQQNLARSYWGWGWGGYWGWGYPYGGWGWGYPYGGYWGRPYWGWRGGCGWRGGWRGRGCYRGGFRGRRCR